MILVTALVVKNMAGQESFEIVKMPFSDAAVREYAPVIIDNKLIFSSNRRSDLFLTHTTDSGKHVPTDLFEVSFEELKKVKQFEPVRKMRIPHHVGAACYNAGNKMVFVTKSNARVKPGNDNRTVHTLGIYYFKMADGKEKMEPFPFNSDSFNIAHPAVLGHNNSMMMVMIADMAGGYGGTDLYLSHFKDGAWSVPTNMGPGINSAENELFPTFDNHGNLYFASNRGGGFGGLDLYKADFHGHTWGEPANMGGRINSSADDFSIVYQTDLKGYFSSNREGSDDIYRFETHYPTFESCDSLRKVYLCYDFFEPATEDQGNLPIVYEWDFGDGSKQRALEASHCFPGTGLYTIQLNVIDTLVDKIFMNEATYELEIEDVKQAHILSPDSVVAGQPVIFSGGLSDPDGFEPTQYYWDFGSEQMIKGKVVEHTFDSAGVYDVQLGVTSSLDSAGNYQSECVMKPLVVVDSGAMEMPDMALNIMFYTDQDLPVVGVDFKVVDSVQTKEILTTSSDGKITIINQYRGDNWLVPELEGQELNAIAMVGGVPVRELPKDENGFVLEPELFKLLGNWNSVSEESIKLLMDSSTFRKTVPDPEIINKVFRVELMRSEKSIKGSRKFRKLDYPVEELKSKDNSEYVYTIGEAENPFDLMKIWRHAIDKGFTEAQVKAFESDGLPDVMDMKMLLEKVNKKLQNFQNKNFEFKDLTFERNSYKIVPESKWELDEVVFLLEEFKSYNLEIMAHTDNVGTEFYNKELSEKRAEAVKKYIVSKGIAQHRVFARGYGESQPRADNTTEAGRTQNRRVEFRLFE